MKLEVEFHLTDNEGKELKQVFCNHFVYDIDDKEFHISRIRKSKKGIFNFSIMFDSYIKRLIGSELFDDFIIRKKKNLNYNSFRNYQAGSRLKSCKNNFYKSPEASD